LGHGPVVLRLFIGFSRFHQLYRFFVVRCSRQQTADGAAP
jgi:hypothetical protein